MRPSEKTQKMACNSEEQQDISNIPGRENYDSRYLGCGRMFSYAHQMHSALAFAPDTVLEVGVGAGIVCASLRAAGIKVTTLDMQPELDPDIIGSVTEIECPDNTFDIAVCCQVLEHLPYEQFETALRELRRVTKLGLILSLPDASRYGFFSAKIPLLPQFRLEWGIPRTLFRPLPKEKIEGSGHHWEIGYRGFLCGRILDSINAAGWETEATWRVPELSWHRFFKLRSKKG